MENGRRLAPLTGANTRIVDLFALFHDSCRKSDGRDAGHGIRGARLAAQFRGQLYDLNDDEFALLYRACGHHSGGMTDAEITVATCWDADRMDLGRVGIIPDKARLCTEAARHDDFYDWALERSLTWRSIDGGTRESPAPRD